MSYCTECDIEIPRGEKMCDLCEEEEYDFERRPVKWEEEEEYMNA